MRTASSRPPEIRLLIGYQRNLLCRSRFGKPSMTFPKLIDYSSSGGTASSSRPDLLTAASRRCHPLSETKRNTSSATASSTENHVFGESLTGRRPSG